MAYQSTEGDARTVSATPRNRTGTGMGAAASAIYGKGPTLGMGEGRPDDATWKGWAEQGTNRADSTYGKAEDYRVNAPKINNQYQGESRQGLADLQKKQDKIGDYNQAIMEGKGPTVAEGQLQAGVDKSIAGQMAAARSARGAGGQAAAMRGAQQQAAQLQAGSAAEAAQIRAQESQAAAGRQQALRGQQAGQIQQQYGLEQGTAVQQAGLESTAISQQQQHQQALNELGLRQQQQAMDAQSYMEKQQLEAFKAQGAADAAQREAGGNMLDSVVGAVGAIASLSDERAKVDLSGGADPSSGPSSGGFGRKGGVMSAFMSDVDSKSMAEHMEDFGVKKKDEGKGGGMDMGQMAGMAKMASSFSSGKEAKQDAFTKGYEAGSKVGVAIGTKDDPKKKGEKKDDKGTKTELPANPYAKVDQQAQKGGISMTYGGSRPSVVDAFYPSSPYYNTPEQTAAVRRSYEDPATSPYSAQNLPANPYGPDPAPQTWGSDRSLKREVGVADVLADEFLDSLEPHVFKYKDPANALNPQEPRSPYLGIYAQDVEAAPRVGESVIMESPEGKRVNTAASVSAALAGLGRLHQRLRALEAQTGKGR